MSNSLDRKRAELAAVNTPITASDIRDSWTRYHGDEILTMKPRKWLVGSWLPLDALVLLYSAPGVGKSFYGLSLALEVASGTEWAGEPIDEPLPVLYVAAERPTDQRDRAEAWRLHHERDLPSGFTLLHSASPPQLTNALDVAALCQEIESSGAKLVVLDTYARMTLGLEENSSSATSPIVEALDRLRRATNGGTVIIVHHAPKNGDTPRGSTALLGGVDMTIQLSKVDTQIRARVEKANAGREPMPLYYSLVPVVLPPEEGEEACRDGAVLVHSGAPKQNPALESHLFDLLAESFSEGATAAQLLSSLRLDLDTPKLSAGTVGKVLTSLHRDGLIVKEGKARLTRWRSISISSNLLQSPPSSDSQ